MRLKTTALAIFCLGVQNRFEGLELDGGVTTGDKWRELKDTIADASLPRLGRTRRHRQHWITGETIALAEQTSLARIQRVPNRRDRRKQTTKANTPLYPKYAVPVNDHLARFK